MNLIGWLNDQCFNGLMSSMTIKITSSASGPPCVVYSFILYPRHDRHSN